VGTRTARSSSAAAECRHPWLCWKLKSIKAKDPPSRMSADAGEPSVTRAAPRVLALSGLVVFVGQLGRGLAWAASLARPAGFQLFERGGHVFLILLAPN